MSESKPNPFEQSVIKDEKKAEEAYQKELAKAEKESEKESVPVFNGVVRPGDVAK